MLIQLIVLIINFLIVVPAFAQEEKKTRSGFCSEELNKQLKTLGWGTASQVAHGIRAESEGKSIEFSTGGGQIPSLIKISKSSTEAEQVLITRLPSSLFPHYEQKDVHLNSECEVVSINLNSGGTATELTPNRCKNILSNYRASISKRGSSSSIVDSLQTEYPKHNWAKCENNYSELVVETCKEYESVFAKSGPMPVGEKRTGNSKVSP